MYAAINAVSGRSWPRKKPKPSSISRSPGAISRSPPAAASTPPSPPARTASSPRRPSRPAGCASAAVIPALSPDLATCSIAFVSDEYDDLDAVSNLTAFARNSGVYRVPFVMVPSSPIELKEMRNKNQVISAGTISATSPDASVVAVEISIWFSWDDESDLRHDAEGHGGCGQQRSRWPE